MDSYVASIKVEDEVEISSRDEIKIKIEEEESSSLVRIKKEEEGILTYEVGRNVDGVSTNVPPSTSVQETIFSYLTNPLEHGGAVIEPGPGPRSRAMATSSPASVDPVERFLRGDGKIDLNSLTPDQLERLATSIASHTAEFSDEEEDDGECDAADEDEEEDVAAVGGGPFSNIFLVEEAFSSAPASKSVSPLLSPRPLKPGNPGRPGLKVNILGQSPVDFFKLFFTDNFLSEIVEKTNRNAVYILLESEAPRARISEWKDLSIGEFFIFLGLLFHMGNIVCSQIRNYWRTDRLFNLPLWANSMSRDRFELILRALHFNPDPPPDQPEGTSEDRLYKVHPVLDHFNNVMETIYSPHREMSIDESMILWRGWLVFQQYIKTKRHKYVIELYVLAEKTGLVHRIMIYTGKTGGNWPNVISHAQCVVSKLLSKVSSQGHALNIDNFFTSLNIVSYLLKDQMYCTGTLRANRIGNPRDVTEAIFRKGGVIQRWNEEGICVLKLKDKRNVRLISTEHTGDTQLGRNCRGQPSQKSAAVIQYDQLMGGVDRMDQLLSYSLLNRRTVRWYKKTGILIFQIMMQNAFLIFKESVPGSGMTQSQFRENIILHLIDEGIRISRPKPRVTAHQPLRANHYPYMLPYIEGSGKKRQQKTCQMCSTKEKRKKVTTYCPSCQDQPGLCIGDCFMNWHERRRRTS